MTETRFLVYMMFKEHLLLNINLKTLFTEIHVNAMTVISSQRLVTLCDSHHSSNQFEPNLSSYYLE